MFQETDNVRLSVEYKESASLRVFESCFVFYASPCSPTKSASENQVKPICSWNMEITPNINRHIRTLLENWCRVRTQLLCFFKNLCQANLGGQCGCVCGDLFLCTLSYFVTNGFSLSRFIKKLPPPSSQFVTSFPLHHFDNAKTVWPCFHIFFVAVSHGASVADSFTVQQTNEHRYKQSLSTLSSTHQTIFLGHKNMITQFWWSSACNKYFAEKFAAWTFQTRHKKIKQTRLNTRFEHLLDHSYRHYSPQKFFSSKRKSSSRKSGGLCCVFMHPRVLWLFPFLVASSKIVTMRKREKWFWPDIIGTRMWK